MTAGLPVAHPLAWSRKARNRCLDGTTPSTTAGTVLVLGGSLTPRRGGGSGGLAGWEVRPVSCRTWIIPDHRAAAPHQQDRHLDRNQPHSSGVGNHPRGTRPAASLTFFPFPSVCSATRARKESKKGATS